MRIAVNARLSSDDVEQKGIAIGIAPHVATDTNAGPENSYQYDHRHHC
jgi:hypothetical protein